MRAAYFIKFLMDIDVQMTMMKTEITNTIKSIQIIHVFVLFLKNTICMTAGKMKVVSTSVKFPIKLTIVEKEGTRTATRTIRQISTTLRIMIFFDLMKS